MNVKNTTKTPIHENADANITCDVGEADISRYRSRSGLHTNTHTHARTHARTHAHTHTHTHTRSTAYLHCPLAR